MALFISTRELSAQPAAVLRGSAPAFQVANVIGDLLPRVAIAVRDSMDGPPFVRYHSLDPEAFEVEVGIPVKPPFTFDPAVTLIELPARTVAATWHSGDYAMVADTVDQLRAAILERGDTPEGPAMEIYWPGDDPLPEGQSRTELLQPLAPR